MANVKISELASAAALTGSEEVPVVQGSATVKTTVQDIANLAGGGGSSTIEILADGTVTGNNSTVQYYTWGILTNASGNQSVPVNTFPNLYLNGGTSTTVTFSTLETGSLSINNFQNLVSISFPALTTVVFTGMSGLSVSSCPNLTTINIPVLTTVLGANAFYSFSNNALSQATVDDILVKFAATTATNSQLNLDGGTNAAPSSVGLAAKATLQGRGWTVTNN